MENCTEISDISTGFTDLFFDDGGGGSRDLHISMYYNLSKLRYILLSHKSVSTCLWTSFTETTFLSYQIKVPNQPSNRIGGAYSINPKAVWEVKEYYDNKTYESRVNDSI